MSESHEWTVCDRPATGDILRWNEPLWAAPTRPRGKPDRVGEQRITAQVTAIGDVLEFKVLTIEKISPGEAVLKVTEGDNIRRKASTLAQGQCHKRTI